MKKQYQAVTAAEAVRVIKSGDHVHISSVSNVPQCLVKALCDRGRAGELKGVITGNNKKLNKGKIVSTFVMGSQKIYNFIDGNHEVMLMDVEYTNDPFVIAQQPKMTSINSAIQIDLSGQVCADSLGDKIYSGVGGQIDYVYGSSRAKGGKAIIAMPSTTRKGINKIVPALDLGSGAVTTRNHIHWFITEYGAVNLYGRSLQERAKLIISVAHPQFQEMLDEAAFKRFGSHFHYLWHAIG